MQSSLIVLDYQEGIALDPQNPPFGNYQAFRSSYEGLKTLLISKMTQPHGSS